MNNNDLLIRLRYALNLRDVQVKEIFALGGVDLSIGDVRNMMTKVSDEDSFETHNMECTYEGFDAFLNGLIIFKRGKQQPKLGEKEAPKPEPSTEPMNNILLKKVKIALKLTSDDILAILADEGVYISKGELSAVLRREGHKNYKECGDRYVRNFLKGLATHYRE